MLFDCVTRFSSTRIIAMEGSSVEKGPRPLGPDEVDATCNAIPSGEVARVMENLLCAATPLSKEVACYDFVKFCEQHFRKGAPTVRDLGEVRVRCRPPGRIGWVMATLHMRSVRGIKTCLQSRVVLDDGSPPTLLVDHLQSKWTVKRNSKKYEVYLSVKDFLAGCDWPLEEVLVQCMPLYPHVANKQLCAALFDEAKAAAGVTGGTGWRRLKAKHVQDAVDACEFPGPTRSV